MKGTVIIDELRLLPQNALMQTFVHDPLIGLVQTSQAAGDSLAQKEIDLNGQQPFNAIVNGVEQAVSGVRSWNVSTLIIIEVYK